MFQSKKIFLPILLFVITAAIFPVPLSAENIRLRIMAANLTTGNYQSYEDPAKRIFQGLQPDVVLIQEFNVGDNTAQETTAFVSDAFGSSFSWFREPGNEQIPNGIISRWPILASGEWNDPEVSNRDFAWARLDIPGRRG